MAATVVHLAVVGLIITMNIAERKTLLEVSGTFGGLMDNTGAQMTHLLDSLLWENEAGLALVIVTAIILQGAIIAVKHIGPIPASN